MGKPIVRLGRFMNMRALRGTLALLVVLLLASCEAPDTEEHPDETAHPDATTESLEPDESAAVVDNQVPSVCEVADCFGPSRPGTLEDLVREADVIAVVRAEREIESLYAIGGLVVSRVELRAESVFKGSAVNGDVLVAHLPGGVSAVTGNPWEADGFKPAAGAPTRALRYAEYPPFQTGKRELVFFREIEADHGSQRLYPMPEGRYRFVQGTLAPLFGQQHRLFDRLAPKGIREELTGRTLPQFEALIGPLIAAEQAADPAPLTIVGDGLVSSVRTRLAGELPHVGAVVDAVETRDVARLSALTSFTPFECTAEPARFVSCEEAGVPAGTMVEMRLGSGPRVFREANEQPYELRADWEAELSDLFRDASPELVAILEPPGGASNRLYLAFRQDRSGPVSAGQPCFVLTLALIPADPVLSLHRLPSCGSIVEEVRSLARTPDAMMQFWALAPELR